MATQRKKRPAGRGASRSERIEPHFDKPRKAVRRKSGSRSGARGKTARRDAKRGSFLGGAIKLVVLVCLLGALAFGVVGIYLTSKLPDPVLLALDDRPPNVKVVAADGTVLAEKGLRRGHVSFAELPPHLIEAVIATEDRRFYSHFGIDPIGLARAAWVDIMAGAFVEGGSTITQQLAKNLFLKPDRTIARKLEEMIYAIWLEKRFDKEQILELYLNRVYFGGGAYGVEAASQRYFGKSARDLNLPESAMLAGLLKAPSTYAPTRSRALANSRLEIVLQNMVEAGFISQAEAKQAAAEPLGLRAEGDQAGYPYIVDWVAELLPQYVGDSHGDLIVDTTIDSSLQKAAQTSLAERLEKEGKEKNASEGAIVVLSPTGAVQALVGGRSYQTSPYNRAVKAKRQPGSAFKPFVYLAAMEAGYSPDSIAYDSPVTVKGWTPKNYEKSYRGEVTLRQGLEHSINSVAVKLVAKIGAARVVNTAHRLGIESTLHMQPSIALGTAEVSLLELTAAYAPFSNGGMRAQVHVIQRIRNADGRTLYVWKESPAAPAVAPAQIGAMNDMLNAVVVSGTGKRAGIPSHVAGGKTGTTQDSRDAWFVGYTAHYLAGVWIGNDDNSPMKKVTGGTIPAEVWHDTMLTAHRDKVPYALPGTYTPGIASAAGQAGWQPRGGGDSSAWLQRMLSVFTGSTN
ncbi:PBP1A family penicillin-binding protein [Methyloligella sp. 2.7D]|uniref:transglycosylase domain-containing protein n=1 Tax=unclassified Methyloligella TaxID=2625955 RepID=UPI00157CF189|nr:PBP1A family penicillin-binding protein [Methyloligella sp. GL2]QKP76039.1 PBP1A family penicillin-binding protein [Methyloligella sp. GL2]